MQGTDGAGISTTDLLDADGNAARNDLAGPAQTLTHVFLWDEDASLSLRRRGDQSVDLVARNGSQDTTIPTGPEAVVRLAAGHRTAVVVDQAKTVVLSAIGSQPWQVRWESDVKSQTACIDPAGHHVLMAGSQNLMLDVTTQRLSARTSVLPRTGACALSGGWTIRADLQTANGAPASDWVAEGVDGKVLWKGHFSALGDVIVSKSEDVACLTFDTPVCVRPTDQTVRELPGSVVTDFDGSLVYVTEKDELVNVSTVL
jgi:hypothetical protein